MNYFLYCLNHLAHFLIDQYLRLSDFKLAKSVFSAKSDVSTSFAFFKSAFFLYN